MEDSTSLRHSQNRLRYSREHAIERHFYFELLRRPHRQPRSLRAACVGCLRWHQHRAGIQPLVGRPARAGHSSADLHGDLATASSPLAPCRACHMWRALVGTASISPTSARTRWSRAVRTTRRSS